MEKAGQVLEPNTDGDTQHISEHSKDREMCHQAKRGGGESQDGYYSLCALARVKATLEQT